jgi:hypothetical protein
MRGSANIVNRGVDGGLKVKNIERLPTCYKRASGREQTFFAATTLTFASLCRRRRRPPLPMPLLPTVATTCRQYTHTGVAIFIMSGSLEVVGQE